MVQQRKLGEREGRSGYGSDCPEASDIVADAMTVSGASVSFSGLDVDDDNDEDEDENKLPPGWIEVQLSP
jgi:hypothetical protein